MNVRLMMLICLMVGCSSPFAPSTEQPTIRTHTTYQYAGRARPTLLVNPVPAYSPARGYTLP